MGWTISPLFGDDRVRRRGYAIHHDVDQQAGLVRGRPSQYPCAADLAYTVVKSDAAVASFAYVPAKDLLVEFRRASYVASRHLDVTDFAVHNCGRHRFLQGNQL
jgi:hypothetical protein